jgi:hypothetical protein
MVPITQSKQLVVVVVEASQPIQLVVELVCIENP